LEAVMRPSARTVPFLRLVALVFLLSATPAYPADRSLEYAVKATFLYKFSFYVDWPPGTFASDAAPFNLCVVGADPFGGRIKNAVLGQSVGRHPIVLHALAKANAQANCQAMVLGTTGGQTVAEALAAMSGTPTLTVTDSTLGPTAGIIHFVIADDRVSFDIDTVLAAKNHLVISSKLLALARKVNTARPGSSP
jgi:hypothetical protein